MGDHHFDHLARQLAGAGASRRAVIRALRAAVPVARSADSREGEAAACRPGGALCRAHADCCSKTCLAAGQFRDRRARCQCERKLPFCGGTTCCTGVNPACCPGNECADLDSDPQHCGACGNVAETDRNAACCGGVVTQLGTVTNCAFCGDHCADRGPAFRCAWGVRGFCCTESPDGWGPCCD